MQAHLCQRCTLHCVHLRLSCPLAHSQTYGALSERCLALVALEVLHVISACHKAGMVHGDIKPGMSGTEQGAASHACWDMHKGAIRGMQMYMCICVWGGEGGM